MMHCNTKHEIIIVLKKLYEAFLGGCIMHLWDSIVLG